MRIFTIRGIPVKIHGSWFIAFALFSYALSTRTFPQAFPALPLVADWALGMIATIMAFVSVLLHELAHSIVALKMMVRVDSIKLFILGGVAEMHGEAPTPKQDAMIAIAGPLMSAFIAAVFWLQNDPLSKYLFDINAGLLLLNILPAYPLDGGRALRDLIWQVTRDYIKATMLSVRLGTLFATLAIAFGILSIILHRGNAMWCILVGAFVAFVNNYYKTPFTKLSNIPGSLTHYITTDVVTVPENLTLQEFFDEYFIKWGYHGYPVVDASGKVIGLLHYLQAKAKLEADEANRQMPVRNFMQDFSNPTPAGAALPIVQQDDSLVHAAEKMMIGGYDRSLVYNGDKFVGILTLSTLLRKGEINTLRSKIASTKVIAKPA